MNTKPKPRLLPGLAVKDGFTRHPFDLEHGTRTSGLIAGHHLSSGHRHDRHSTAYYAVAPSVFKAMIVRWRRSHPPRPSTNTHSWISARGWAGRCCWPPSCPFARSWAWS